MRRIIVIALILMSYLGSQAQVRINFAWYDKHTYQLYQDKNWPRLLELGHDAIEAGHDFYYLRMRLGIAYYEQGKYRSAISQFTRALKFNNNDPLAAEYLYYSYKFSGRVMDANLVYAKYKSQLKSREITSPYGFISGLYAETGIKLISPSNSEYGSLLYAHIGAEQQLGSRLNLYQGYMRYSQNVFELESVPGFGGGSFLQETKRKYVQNEYFLKAIIPVIKGFQLIGSLHTQAIIDTIRYANISYLAGFSSSFKFIDFSITYGASRISETYQQQIAAGIIFYPVMNQNLYLQSILTYHVNAEQRNIIFYQKIGLRTGENTWFEFYGSFGNMKNVQELDGFYVYNLNNNLNMRLGVSGIFLLGKRVKLIVGYTNESYTELTTSLPFKHHYLFTGLQVLLKTN